MHRSGRSGTGLLQPSFRYQTAVRASHAAALVEKLVEQDLHKEAVLKKVYGIEITLNNCTVFYNEAVAGGGAEDCILNNCTLTNNFARWVGGGAENCTLNNCILNDNYGDHGGGGASGSTLNNCTLTGNVAVEGGGGGAFLGCKLNNCRLTGNEAPEGGGAEGCTLYDCTLTGNTTDGSGGGASGCTLYNCTLTGNYARIVDGGADECTLYNCILYFNSVDTDSIFTNWANYDPDGYSTLNYCCTTPLPTNGVGNITNEPLFVDYADGNMHLQSDSPCINAGDNAYVTTTNDLDGNPRIVGGTVDMGAYEYQTPTSILSYAWAQEYGLPTDGSADYADLEGTGMENWQKSVAGLNPTNGLSVLTMLPPVPTNNPSGLVVSWQSVDTRMYFLQCSTNLGAQAAFLTIQSNIVGQVGTTSFTDTNAVGTGPYIYRVGVQ